MILAFLVEIIQVLTYAAHEVDFFSVSTKVLNMFEGIFLYSLFYMMCLCAPVDIAKKELLRTNLKFAGMLFGVLCGLQYLLQALFLDPIIGDYLNQDFFADRAKFYSINSISLVCSIIAFLSIFGIVKEEMKELRTFDQGDMEDDEYFEETGKKRRNKSKRRSDMARHPISQGVYFDESDDEQEQEYTVKDLRGGQGNHI